MENIGLTLDKRSVILMLSTYEDAVEKPYHQRHTYVDENRHVHLKAGDEYYKDYIDHALACGDYIRFCDDVDLATCGALDQYVRLKVRDTPKLMLDAGFKQLPMLYTQRHLFDAIHPKSDGNYHWHGLGVSQVKRFPEMLANPVMMCESPSRDDVILVVLQDVDCDSLPLMLAIKPGGSCLHQSRQVDSNFILSAYGKRNFEDYLRNKVAPENVIYFDKERGRELERLARIQFPEYYSNLDHGVIIRQPRCLVKPHGRQASLLSRCQDAQTQVSQDVFHGKEDLTASRRPSHDNLENSH